MQNIIALGQLHQVEKLTKIWRHLEFFYPYIFSHFIPEISLPGSALSCADPGLRTRIGMSGNFYPPTTTLGVVEGFQTFAWAFKSQKIEGF